MDTNILLENGTNELEILEFILDGYSYGINVAKIREIIPYQRVTPIPNAHPSIEGIFMPRETMITAINLSNCLGHEDTLVGGMFIITNFNQLNIAFHVEDVLGIHRLSWTELVKPDHSFGSLEDTVITGVVKRDDHLIVLLDFEKIICDINPETGLRTSAVEAMGKRSKNNVPILIAEDSPLLNKLIVEALTKAGYENLTHTENGQEAYDFVQKCKKEGTLKEKVRCIITDIEMPMMDGHRLTKLIKSDEATKHIPVVIFSSLVNEDMKRKGKALGVDAQISKPEVGDLVKVIEELL
ncbi:MAG: chemotaxis protein [Acetatifactor sp.]|nr:chemotaxis protein [Acetatifactor sp.]